jgi:hypothetical protein
VAENFFDLANFLAGFSGDLFAHAFRFHIGVVVYAAMNLARFATRHLAHALRSITQTAFHNFPFDN